MVNVSAAEDKEAQAKGRRAEDVASWYFLLNGFLSITGFKVHLQDIKKTKKNYGKKHRNSRYGS